MTTGALQDEKAPDWSPDSSRIVYGKGSSVWRMNADGTGQEQVVANSVLPAWSPDGTRIVFSSSSFGAPNGPDIFTVDPDGNNVSAPLTGAPFIDNDPNWQPLTTPPDTTTTTSTTSSTTSSTIEHVEHVEHDPGHHHIDHDPGDDHDIPPTTAPTTPTTISDLCRRILDSQRRFNAVLDAQQNEILDRNLDPRVRMSLLAQLQAARDEGNATFNRQLAANGCFTPPDNDDHHDQHVSPADHHDRPGGHPTTTIPPTSTTAPTTTVPPAQSVMCARIRQAQQRFNADLDARQREILSRNLDPSVRIVLLAQLAAVRAQGNAEYNRLLAHQRARHDGHGHGCPGDDHHEDTARTAVKTGRLGAGIDPRPRRRSPDDAAANGRRRTGVSDVADELFELALLGAVDALQVLECHPERVPELLVQLGGEGGLLLGGEGAGADDADLDVFEVVLDDLDLADGVDTLPGGGVERPEALAVGQGEQVALAAEDAVSTGRPRPHGHGWPTSATSPDS